MKLMMKATAKANTDFTTRYTKDSDGFYVRNRPPSSGTMNETRLADNMRQLAEEMAKCDEKHK